MKNKILEELKKIEEKENVKILYAVESGSRAWGFPSKDSDYDVRFIYVRPEKWYLSIKEGRDVLEYPICDDLDFVGWDLKKALNLYRKSNPSLIEWLMSPVIYMEAENLKEELNDLSSQYISKKALLYHYLNMAKGNYRGYLQGEEVKAKKYFYVLRTIFACNWILEYGVTPPIVFDELLSLPSIPTDVKDTVKVLLERKKESREMETEPKIQHVNNYINEEIKAIQEEVKNFVRDKDMDLPFEPLDKLFRSHLY